MAQFLEFISNHFLLAGAFVALLVLFVANEGRRGGRTVSAQEQHAIVSALEDLGFDAEAEQVERQAGGEPVHRKRARLDVAHAGRRRHHRGTGQHDALPVAAVAALGHHHRHHRIADGDTGYGGLLNVRHTVRGYETAGIAGIQLEDQEFPKKCGHTPGRRVIPFDDAVRKIEVAVDARRDHGQLGEQQWDAEARKVETDRRMPSGSPVFTAAHADEFLPVGLLE